MSSCRPHQHHTGLSAIVAGQHIAGATSTSASTAFRHEVIRVFLAPLAVVVVAGGGGENSFQMCDDVWTVVGSIGVNESRARRQHRLAHFTSRVYSSICQHKGEEG